MVRYMVGQASYTSRLHHGFVLLGLKKVLVQAFPPQDKEPVPEQIAQAVSALDEALKKLPPAKTTSPAQISV
ncbi:hypothetical protein U8607_21980 [Methylobacterium durans]|uniref:hypothetical protein n=1 Tax=Methylobacterium durans TaxID=2202825 RepID=UPI002AFE8441|nr:hypothetical protein [Methylobacterium durans]MEA1834768.1 hypothetical protein [Methylobacterium durans]